MMFKFTALCICIGTVSATAITVNSQIGQIIGDIKSVNVGPETKDIATYIGIPYAEPPVANLRFSKPVPKANFDTPFSATKSAASCLQFPPPGLDMGIQNEDCLYLNIFSPDLKQNGTQYPVMIWIHGGAFVFGNGKGQTFEKLAAFGDIVVVTLNYRLGPFGFLNTGDGDSNFGLWDQHTSIKWVNANIGSFGGDPGKITIAGESAGGASVMFQAIYPGSEGLFIRAIAQSGSANAGWAIVQDPVTKAQEYAKKFNCSVSSSQEIIKCLRAVQDTSVMAMMQSITSRLGEGLDWSPSIDGDFVTKDRIDALNNAEGNNKLPHFKNLDLMMGTVCYEGQLFLPQPPYTNDYLVFKDSVSVHDIENAARHIVSLNLQFFNDVDVNEGILDDVMLLYSNFEAPSDTNLTVKRVVDLLTDTMFLVPASTSLASHAFENTNSVTYQYEFGELYPFRPHDPWLTGASHTDELPYVFGSIYDTGVQQNMSTDDLNLQWKLSSAMMTYWTNFIKTGDPNSPAMTPVQWDKFTEASKQYLYLRSDRFQYGVNLHGRRMVFWTEYFPKILKRLQEKNEEKRADCHQVSSSVIISGHFVSLLISGFLYLTLRL